MMHFSNLNCVIGKVVVNYVWQVFGLAEESEYFSVIIQELFLRWHFATSEGFLHELLHVIVTRASDFL
jgi:hypothetical protein